MKSIKIPVGRSNFGDIRKNGYYFIDKSNLIKELLKTDARQVTLITRPRRFGKTLGMSMLSDFFDIQKDSRALFDGLSILNHEELCKSWMNQYPTLFLSFRSVDGLNFEGAYGLLTSVIAELYKKHIYLMESPKVSVLDKELFYKTAARTADLAELKNSLTLLTRIMAAHYEKPVILLIDEYDVPLAKASEKNYYTEMLDLIKGLMQVIKDNDYLKFSVITGCLKIAKESIFTGTNNFVSDTISDTRLNEYFGFTQKEVQQLLEDTALTGHMAEIKAWYDGYHFGDFDVYCPWDVMNHVEKLLLNPQTKPASYWKNSSDNAIIRSFIDYAGNTITRKFETLLAGGTIIQKVEENLTYPDLYSSEENLWSILYLTGYLTHAEKKEEPTEPAGDCLPLTIPNAEIMGIFETTIKKWFDESALQWERQALFSAIWNGDAEKASGEITKLLRKTISYHDYREDFYHAFLAGIFAGAGYMVESNREHGEGRSDIVVEDPGGDRVAVFEIKYAKSQEGLAAASEDALIQMEKRRYTHGFTEDYSTVIGYGIAFFRKRCLVLCLDGNV